MSVPEPLWPVQAETLARWAGADEFVQHVTIQCKRHGDDLGSVRDYVNAVDDRSADVVLPGVLYVLVRDDNRAEALRFAKDHGANEARVDLGVVRSALLDGAPDLDLWCPEGHGLRLRMNKVKSELAAARADRTPRTLRV